MPVYSFVIQTEVDLYVTGEAATGEAATGEAATGEAATGYSLISADVLYRVLPVGVQGGLEVSTCCRWLVSKYCTAQTLVEEHLCDCAHPYRACRDVPMLCLPAAVPIVFQAYIICQQHRPATSHWACGSPHMSHVNMYDYPPLKTPHLTSHFVSSYMPSS